MSELNWAAVDTVLAKAIESTGWAVWQGVTTTGMRLAHTIGRANKGQPEVFCVGLAPAAVPDFFRRIVECMEADVHRRGLVELNMSRKTCIQEVPYSVISPELWYLDKYQKGSPCTVLQVHFQNSQGHFAWESQFRPEDARSYPLFCAPPVLLS